METVKSICRSAFESLLKGLPEMLNVRTVEICHDFERDLSSSNCQGIAFYLSLKRFIDYFGRELTFGGLSLTEAGYDAWKVLNEILLANAALPHHMNQ